MVQTYLLEKMQVSGSGAVPKISGIQVSGSGSDSGSDSGKK
jgi:hypothetical protein